VSELVRASRRQEQRKRQLSCLWNSGAGWAVGDSAVEFQIRVAIAAIKRLENEILEKHQARPKVIPAIDPTFHSIFQISAFHFRYEPFD
jgi:hypothetical protein